MFSHVGIKPTTPTLSMIPSRIRVLGRVPRASLAADGLLTVTAHRHERVSFVITHITLSELPSPIAYQPMTALVAGI